MKKDTKSTSATMEELIFQIRDNVQKDRAHVEEIMEAVIQEAEDGNSTEPYSRSCRSLKELMEIKVKSNDTLVKLAASVQKKEQSERKMMDEDEEELDTEAYLEELYEKMSQ